MTRKLGLLAGVAAVALMAAPAMAQQAGVRGNRAGDFLIGASVLGVLPTNNGGGITGPSQSVPLGAVTGSVSASNYWTGQLDFTYFVTNNISLNLIAATTRHNLSATNVATTATGNVGAVDLGSVWALPPTLTVQYHPVNGIRFDPYVGVGLNYTWFYNEGGYRGAAIGSTPFVVQSLNVRNAMGAALNVGMNYELTPNWLLNFDFKYLFLRPNATVGTNLPGAPTLSARAWLDPVVFAIGIRYRF